MSASVDYGRKDAVEGSGIGRIIKAEFTLPPDPNNSELSQEFDDKPKNIPDGEPGERPGGVRGRSRPFFLLFLLARSFIPLLLLFLL